MRAGKRKSLSCHPSMKGRLQTETAGGRHRWPRESERLGSTAKAPPTGCEPAPNHDNRVPRGPEMVNKDIQDIKTEASAVVPRLFKAVIALPWWTRDMGSSPPRTEQSPGYPSEPRWSSLTQRAGLPPCHLASWMCYPRTPSKADSQYTQGFPEWLAKPAGRNAKAGSVSSHPA